MARMFTDKLTARVVGVLFIVASVTAIVGGSLVGDSDALGDLVGVQHRVITGVLIELVLVVSVVGIAVLAFPVLRRRDEGPDARGGGPAGRLNRRSGRGGAQR
jgi:hypothetical protein